ncbi:MAG: hypothetical protein AAB794_01795 [Patescibacteria group bacterium]
MNGEPGNPHGKQINIPLESVDSKQRFRNAPERIADIQEFSNAIEALKAEGREDILRLLKQNEGAFSWEEKYQEMLDRISEARDLYRSSQELKEKLWKAISPKYYYLDSSPSHQEVFCLEYILSGYFPDNRNPSPGIRKIRDVITRRKNELIGVLDEASAEYAKPPELLSLASGNILKEAEERRAAYIIEPSVRGVPEIRDQVVKKWRGVGAAEGRKIIVSISGLRGREYSPDNKDPVDPNQSTIVLFNPADWLQA